MVVPLAPPPIIGLGTGGGFAYVLQDCAAATQRRWRRSLRGLMVAANQNPS